MSDSAIDILPALQFLAERFDKIRNEARQRDFLRNLIASEAMHNLDLIRILRLKGIEERPEEKHKVMQSLRTHASQLIENLGLAPSSVLTGAFSEDVELLNREYSEDPVQLSSLEDFRKQSELWLYYFVYRKLSIMKELSLKGFDLDGLLNVERRVKNLSLALIALSDALRAPCAV